MVTVSFLFFIPPSFAEAYNYPWYFKVNKIEDCWKKTKGDDVILDIIDSEAHFISVLKGKEYCSKSYIDHDRVADNKIETFREELGLLLAEANIDQEESAIKKLVDAVKANSVVDMVWKERISSLFNNGKMHEVLDQVSDILTSAEVKRIHGTCMASIIAADVDKSVCDHDGIVVAGIAPNVKIISRESIREYVAGDAGIENAILDSIDMREVLVPLESNDKPQFKIDREVKLVLLNISAGKRVKDRRSVSSWLDFIKRNEMNNKYFLIISAIGNDGIDLAYGYDLCLMSINKKEELTRKLKDLPRQYSDAPVLIKSNDHFYFYYFKDKKRKLSLIDDVAAIQQLNSLDFVPNKIILIERNDPQLNKDIIDILSKYYIRQSPDQYRLAPALVGPTKTFDPPIIRVGATSMYTSGEVPEIYLHSNYGKKHIDILSPGQSIPVLTPDGRVINVGGTSEATAIVTAAVALLAKCHPHASANDIKHRLLDNVDNYLDLERKVENGRVLNISMVVNRYCSNDPDIIEIETEPSISEKRIFNSKKIIPVAIAIAAAVGVPYVYYCFAYRPHYD